MNSDISNYHSAEYSRLFEAFHFYSTIRTSIQHLTSLHTDPRFSTSSALLQQIAQDRNITLPNIPDFATLSDAFNAVSRQNLKHVYIGTKQIINLDATIDWIGKQLEHCENWMTLTNIKEHIRQLTPEQLRLLLTRLADAKKEAEEKERGLRDDYEELKTDRVAQQQLTELVDERYGARRVMIQQLTKQLTELWGVANAEEVELGEMTSLPEYLKGEEMVREAIVVAAGRVVRLSKLLATVRELVVAKGTEEDRMCGNQGTG